MRHDPGSPIEYCDRLYADGAILAISHKRRDRLIEAEWSESEDLGGVLLYAYP